MIFPFVRIFTVAIVTRWMFVAMRDVHRKKEQKCALALDMYKTESIRQRYLRGGILTNSIQQHHLRGFVGRISM